MFLHPGRIELEEISPERVDRDTLGVNQKFLCLSLNARPTSFPACGVCPRAAPQPGTRIKDTAQ